MRFTLAALSALALAATSHAEILRVNFEGQITHVGAAIPANQPIPTNFMPGDDVWGTYAYDTLAPLISQSSVGSQYAAIRQLAINAERGFYANSNNGVVTVRGPRFNVPITVYDDGVTTWPPLRLVTQAQFVDDVDDAGQLPPVPWSHEAPIDLDDFFTLPSYVPDVESATQASLEAERLGFPPMSEAFLAMAPLAIHLKFIGHDVVDDESLASHPEHRNLAGSVVGSIYFGPYLTNAPEFAVEFQLTSFTVVPEPSAAWLTMAALGTVICLTRRSSSARCDYG